MRSRPIYLEYCNEITATLSGDIERDICSRKCIFQKSGTIFLTAWISVDPRDKVSGNDAFLRPHIKENLFLELTLRNESPLRNGEQNYTRQPDHPVWNPSRPAMAWPWPGRSQLKAWILIGGICYLFLFHKK